MAPQSYPHFLRFWSVSLILFDSPRSLSSPLSPLPPTNSTDTKAIDANLLTIPSRAIALISPRFAYAPGQENWSIKTQLLPIFKIIRRYLHPRRHQPSRHPLNHVFSVLTPMLLRFDVFLALITTTLPSILSPNSCIVCAIEWDLGPKTLQRKECTEDKCSNEYPNTFIKKKIDKQRLHIAGSTLFLFFYS